MSVSGLNSIEKKAAYSLALVFGLRMLGLFMILPVFAIYGMELEGYTPMWLGLAIGAYGLTQALLQIPMGILSDKYGRKTIIIIGLLIFLVGSVVAATATTIYGVVAGRALQGAGAIASAVLALAADLTREEQRPKVMATIGMFIGLAFTVSMILGPIIADNIGLSGIFWFTAELTIFAIVMVKFIVPNSVSKAPKGDLVALPKQMLQLIGNGQLFRLNMGVFVLHMVLTACFVTLPKSFVDAGLTLNNHWMLYLPTLLGSFFLMVPFMIWAIKKQQEKPIFLASIMLLVITLALLYSVANNLTVLFFATLLFFTAFNYLEATMPSMLSRIAPAGAKGSAMGVFTSSQFLGAFCGGVIGGIVAEQVNEQAIFMVMLVFTLLWLVFAVGMKPVKKSKSYSFSLQVNSERECTELAEKLIVMNGVVEATLVHSEKVAYMKLNDKEVDFEKIRSLLNKS